MDLLSHAVGRLSQPLTPLARWRTPTELLLTAACLTAGLVNFRDGPAVGFLGTITGALLASEVVRRRASVRAALLAATAFGAGSALASHQPNLLVGLLNIAAATLPLHRPTLSALALSQLFLVLYVVTFVAPAVLTNGAVAWWQLLINVVVFNVITGASSDLASRRRRLEVRLADQVRDTEEVALAMHRGEVLRRAMMAVRDAEADQAVLGRLVRGSRDLTGADLIQVLLPPGADEPSRRGPISASTAEWDRVVLPRSPRASGVLAQVLERCQPLWSTSLTVEDLKELRLPFAVSAVGLVPIVVSGSAFGILEVARRDAPDFDRTERELAVALTEQAGTALERAALRAELAERAEGAEGLHRVGANLAGRRDIHEIAEDVVTALSDLYGAAAAVFYLAGEDGSTRPLIAHKLRPERFGELYDEYAGERRGIRLRMGRAQVMMASASDRRAATRRLLAELDIATLVDVPAISRGRLVGGLVLYHHQPREYRPHELDLLETFAHQLGGGIELVQAYEKAEAVDRQREEFLALVSHDLRQPVVAIATVAEALAKSRQLSSQERIALDGLREQARSLALFAEDVLSISQIESGQLKLCPVPFDVRVLAEALARQSLGADRIDVDVPADPVLISGDAKRMGQAIENLLRNALAYSPESTRVLLRVRAETTTAVIEVVDSGVGLDPEDISRLFAKYSRVREGPGGFGLGLYLSRMMVEAHGGVISAESPGPGEGSTFRISMPLTSSDR